MADDVKKEALDKALKLVIESLEQGKDFVEEQAPLLVNDIISYGRWSNVAYMAIALIGPTILWTIVGCLYKRTTDEDWERDGTPISWATGILALVAAGATIAGTINFFCAVDPCLQA